MYSTGAVKLLTSNVNKFLDNIKRVLKGEGCGVMGWT
jgi:hypothetical protein